MAPEILGRRIVPGDILDLAEKSVVVHFCVEAWRLGDLSWEQAMMSAVVSLARLNDSFVQLGAEELAKIVAASQP